MKTLTTTALVAALTLSGSAFAASDFFSQHGDLLIRNSNALDNSYGPKATQSGNDFWEMNAKLLERNSNPLDDSFTVASQDVIGSQPGVGSASGTVSVHSTTDFFAKYGHLIDRTTNKQK